VAKLSGSETFALAFYYFFLLLLFTAAIYCCETFALETFALARWPACKV
jgi:hypothetical protein